MNPRILVSSIAILACLPVHAAPKTVEPVAKTAIISKQPQKIHADLKGSRQLFLVATDGGDGIMADWADWMEPVLIKADGTKIKLTDVKPKSAQVGFGKLGVNVNAGGKPMRVEGKSVAFGFGTHAPAILVEMAFVSHVKDEARLASRRFRRTMAEGIAAGIADYARRQGWLE